MTKLPNEEFRKMVPLLREKDFYEEMEPRGICWADYTAAQINEVRYVLDFIRDSVDCCENRRFHWTGRPLTDARQLTKTALLSEFMMLTERQTQGWLGILGPYIGVDKQLDDRVIGEAYDRPEVVHMLKQVFKMTVESDGRLSGDGTGLETSRKQNYELKKSTGGYLVSIVDSREIVQAFEINDIRECLVMRRLIKLVEGESIRLDAGFNSRDLTDEAAKLGLVPFIFPKKNNKLNGSPAWKSMYLELFVDVIRWLIEYHIRSHAESFHSSFKRRNKILMKRRACSELSQVTARIIIHNIRKLIYYRLYPPQN